MTRIDVNMCWIHYEIVVLKSMPTYFQFTYNHAKGINATAATDSPSTVKSTDDKSEDAKSVHQNPLVVCY